MRRTLTASRPSVSAIASAVSAIWSSESVATGPRARGAGRAQIEGALVAGHDVVAEAGAVREQISLAGQQASLDERLTGRENLMLLGRLQRLSKADAIARTSELLARFGVEHAADRQVGTYSGGMRRRLDLAACLVVPRPVVFLDEPTTGLDPASRAEMWTSIEGLVADGVALLLTTQYLDEADRLADQIVVLAGGRTVAAGTPAQLKARVGDRRVHLSLPDADALQDAARLFERREPELDLRARRLSVPAPEGPQDLRAVLDALEDAGVAVEEAALSQPTLDDAFFALAGQHGRPVLEEAA
ncbi:MAG TPA: ATP-binding cassette domain-containing protein [Solirubrobacteraceae bacterium]|nr:ATP-binding cassette domain-containing protein [Solirubrobacteraceae bacterium]